MNWLNPGVPTDFFIKAVMNGLKRFFCWLMMKFLNHLSDLLELLLPLLPDAVVDGIMIFSKTLKAADAWFPVTLTLQVIGFTIGVFIWVMVVKIIRRFLPF